ncbi:hypothetical protein ACVI1L_001525 [Bradyrhizobium sp. USDA 4516]
MTGHFGQFQPADDQCDDADRDIDDEDPAPVEGDQHASRERAQCGGKAADRRPGAHRPGALLGRKRRQQQADRGWRHQCRTGRLRHAGDDQELDTGGQRTCRRRGREQRDAEQEAEIAAVAFGEPAEEHQQRRVGNGVGIEDPGQILKRGGAKFLRDVRQPDIDDEQIEIGEANSDRHDRKHLARGCGGDAGPRPRIRFDDQIDGLRLYLRHHTLRNTCICIYCH